MMMRARTRAVRAALAVAALGAVGVGCSSPKPGLSGPDRAVAFTPGWRFPAGSPAASAPHAMIASDAAPATRAGLEVLRRGGNAVDGAVATAFALAVTLPQAGNLGGGGYMVVHMADGRAAALDFREVAPRAASPDMYLRADRLRPALNPSEYGPLSVAVPSSVQGLLAAHARYGRLPIAEVIAPAIRLAEEGFVVDSALSKAVDEEQLRILPWAGASMLFPNGAPIARGATLRQPALARTLRRIAEHGVDGFVRGETAAAIASEVQRAGGILTEEDLTSYQPVWRDPVVASWRGFTLLAMPPSSSGGTTIVEMLKVLDGFSAPGDFGTTRWIHRYAAASQRVFVDRNARIADPAFQTVPVARMTSASYTSALRATIDTLHATPTRDVVERMRVLNEGTETTHLSVVDSAGNAVALTTTINAWFGSGFYVAAAGIFLNDEMDDFATRPGRANMFGLVQGEANNVAPGKRPLSAMSPTIVLDKNGAALMALGAAGGPRIISATAQVILNTLVHRMSLADAVNAPRLHHQALPDSLRYEPGGLSSATMDSLRAMGWNLEPMSSIARINAVRRVPGGWEGMNDGRAAGLAAGY